MGPICSHTKSEACKVFSRVASVNIIKDRYSGISKGFAFVEMPIKAEAQATIAGLNGKELKGQKLAVSEARPRRGEQQDGGGYYRTERRSW